MERCAIGRLADSTEEEGIEKRRGPTHYFERNRRSTVPLNHANTERDTG